MNSREKAKNKILDKINELEDMLLAALPKTDKKHLEEILDILSLVRYRSEQYVNEYGINEIFEETFGQS